MLEVKTIDTTMWENSQCKARLDELVSRKTLPNLILHGHTKTTINACKYLLDMLYPRKSKYIYHERIEKVNSKVIKIPIFSTNVHIEVLISDFGYNSRSLLPKLLLELASTKNIMTQEHKVIVLHGVENLPKQTQYILRGNFEMIMRNCRVILLTKNIHKLIEPLQSRCLDIRVPNLYPIDKHLIEENDEKYQFYENIVDDLVKNLGQLPFKEVTDILYMLMCKNVSFRDIMKRSLLTIHQYEMIDVGRVYELAALYDDKINASSRNFIHLQTFFIELRVLIGL